MKLQQLIRHTGVNANPMNYTEYAGLGWRILTDLGTEIISHPGGINGYNSFIGFNPAKQVGVVLLCRCKCGEYRFCITRHPYKYCIDTLGSIHLVSNL